MSDRLDPSSPDDASVEPTGSGGLEDPFDGTDGTPRERPGPRAVGSDEDPATDPAVGDGGSAAQMLHDIAADPVTFAGNLGAAVVEGGSTFAGNAVSHLSAGLNSWVQETVGGEQNLGDVGSSSGDDDDGDDEGDDEGGGDTIGEFEPGFEVGDASAPDAPDPAVYVEEIPSGLRERSSEFADPFDDPIEGGAHLADDAGL